MPEKQQSFTVENQPRTERAAQRRLAARVPRHAVLLVTLLSLYIINPFVQAFFSSRPGLILLDLLVSTTLLVVTYEVHRSKRVLLVAAVFAVPAIAGRWAAYAVYSDWLSIFSHCFGFLFLAFTAVAILLNVLRPVRVTGDIVNGAVCVYMLVGLGIHVLPA